MTSPRGRPRDPSWLYTVTARNHAQDSENLIHDDTVAAQYGFRGGLVPGVDVYAYLAHPPAAAWGLDWLRHGGLSARFASPVYDGETVTVEGLGTEDGIVELSLSNPAGDVCAVATATERIEGVPPDPGAWPRGAAESRGAPASATSLTPGTALVPVEVGFHADRAGTYLSEIGEELTLYTDERIAHPGWLLRLANFVLAAHVRLGPWIHVSSSAVFFDVVRDGERVETLARVIDEYERKGHRFVELDVLITAEDRPVQHVTHTAIHTPRAPS